MKKLILSMIAFTIVNATQIWAQTKENTTKVSFCGVMTDNDILKYADLHKCDELLLSNKNQKIKSFVLTANMLSDDGKGDGVFQEVTNSGSKLSKEGVDFIKKVEAQKRKKLLIENVIIYDTDGKTEKKIPGLVVNLKD